MISKAEASKAVLFLPAWAQLKHVLQSAHACINLWPVGGSTEHELTKINQQFLTF